MITLIIILACAVVTIAIVIGLWALDYKDVAVDEETKPNIIDKDVKAVYMGPIWSRVISIALIAILAIIFLSVKIFLSWLLNITIETIYGYVSETALTNIDIISYGVWAIVTGLTVFALYQQSNRLDIKTGDCGVIQFLKNRISPIGNVIFYLKEGSHWSIEKLFSAISVTITKHKIDWEVLGEFSADNIKMKLKAYLLFSIIIPNNFAAYMEEIEDIIKSAAMSASKTGVNKISMTEGMGTVSPVTDNQSAIKAMQEMMKKISANRENGKKSLKQLIFQELHNISEDVFDGQQDIISSEKLGIRINFSDLNIEDLVPLSETIVGKLELFVSEMLEKVSETADIQTFTQLCKLLRTGLPTATDKEIATIIQRSQGKFKGAETFFWGLEGVSGGDKTSTAVLAELLKNSKK